MSQDPFQALYSGIGGAPLLHLTTIESIYPTVCVCTHTHTYIIYSDIYRYYDIIVQTW